MFSHFRARFIKRERYFKTHWILVDWQSEPRKRWRKSSNYKQKDYWWVATKEILRLGTLAEKYADCVVILIDHHLEIDRNSVWFFKNCYPVRVRCQLPSRLRNHCHVSQHTRLRGKETRLHLLYIIQVIVMEHHHFACADHQGKWKLQLVFCAIATATSDMYLIPENFVLQVCLASYCFAL